MTKYEVAQRKDKMVILYMNFFVRARSSLCAKYVGLRGSFRASQSVVRVPTRKSMVPDYFLFSFLSLRSPSTIETQIRVAVQQRTVDRKP